MAAAAPERRDLDVHDAGGAKSQVHRHRILRTVSAAGVHHPHREQPAASRRERPHLGTRPRVAAVLVQDQHRDRVGAGRGEIVPEQEVLAGGAVVRQRKIEVPIPIEIGPLHAVRGVVAEDDARQYVNEGSISHVAVEIIPVVLNVRQVGGDVQVRTAVVVEVAPRGGRRMIVARDTRGRRDIGERPAVVPEQLIRPVVGDEQVEVAVVVVVADARPDAAEDRRAPGAVHAQLLRDVDEAPGVVAEEPVRIAVLVRDEEVQIAVLIHVEPDRADRLARVREAHRRRHVHEPAAVIPEEHVRAIPERDEQVHVPVVVEVDPGGLPRRAP